MTFPLMDEKGESKTKRHPVRIVQGENINSQEVVTEVIWRLEIEQ